jgi:hypothetical protein
MISRTTVENLEAVDLGDRGLRVLVRHLSVHPRGSSAASSSPSSGGKGPHLPVHRRAPEAPGGCRLLGGRRFRGH